MKDYKYAASLMEKLDFPQEAKKAIIQAEEKILNNHLANKLYESIYKEYWVKNRNFFCFKGRLFLLARTIKEPVYTVNFVLLINCTEPLLDKYRQAGISEEIYYASVTDLKSKLMECYETHRIWGTFVEDWFLKFYTLERFALGRMQYEFIEFRKDRYCRHGVELKKGDRVINIHIPSHQGPLTYEARLDSYKKAYEFFADARHDKPGVFVCDSWLLYPQNVNILPKSSNSCDFIIDFEPLEYKKKLVFEDAWRVFGGEGKNPPSRLPRNTSMQRAFADWLIQGKKTGDAYCILIFDGENILTRRDMDSYIKEYCNDSSK